MSDKFDIMITNRDTFSHVLGLLEKPNNFKEFKRIAKQASDSFDIKTILNFIKQICPKSSEVLYFPPLNEEHIFYSSTKVFDSFDYKQTLNVSYVRDIITLYVDVDHYSFIKKTEHIINKHICEYYNRNGSITEEIIKGYIELLVYHRSDFHVTHIDVIIVKNDISRECELRIQPRQNVYLTDNESFELDF